MLCVSGGFFFFLVQKQDVLFWSLGGDQAFRAGLWLTEVLARRWQKVPYFTHSHVFIFIKH